MNLAYEQIHEGSVLISEVGYFVNHLEFELIDRSSEMTERQNIVQDAVFICMGRMTETYSCLFGAVCVHAQVGLVRTASQHN